MAGTNLSQTLARGASRPRPVALMPVAPGVRRTALKTGGFRLTEARYSPNQTLPQHAHERAVLSFIVDGWVRERRGSTDQICRPRGLVSIPAGEPHGETFPAPGTRCLIIEVPDERAATMRSLSPEFAWPSYTSGAPVAALGLAAYREFRHPDNLSSLAIEGLVLQLATLVMRRDWPAPSTRASRWLDNVREMIHANFRGPRPLRIAELAVEAQVHPVYLARAFRRRYRCSPAEYVRRLRVEAAAELLAGSRASLARVASAAGFSDQSHLSRQFRAWVGMSPGEYRRSVGT
jgi:AraC family transcriptional regulator